MVGKGQPPKKPEDLRRDFRIRISPKERETIESGRKAENTKETLSAYIRNAALQRSQNAMSKNNEE